MDTDKSRVEEREPASPAEALEPPLLVPKSTPPKGRLLSWVILLALVGVSLAVAVLWQRDTTVIHKAEQRLEPFRRSIEAEIAATRQLPLAPPRTDPDGRPLPEKGFTYLDPELVRYLRDYDGPVMVGMSGAHGLAIKSDGRATVFCDKSSCEIRWMSHDEISRQRKLQEEWITRRQEELLQAPPKLP